MHTNTDTMAAKRTALADVQSFTGLNASDAAKLVLELGADDARELVVRSLMEQAS